MVEITYAWRNSTVEANKQLFNGSVDSNLKLGTLISNGYMLGRDALDNQDDLTLSNLVTKALTIVLIPTVWALAPKGFHPVIIRVSNKRITQTR